MQKICILFVMIGLCGTSHSYKRKKQELLNNLSTQITKNKKMAKKIEIAIGTHCKGVSNSNKSFEALSFSQVENEHVLGKAQHVLKSYSKKGRNSKRDADLKKKAKALAATIKDKKIAKGLTRHIVTVRSCCDYRLKKKLLICQKSKKKLLPLFMDEEMFKQTCYQKENSGKLDGGTFYNTSVLCEQIAKKQMNGKCQRHLSMLMQGVRSLKKSEFMPIEDSYSELEGTHEELRQHLKLISNGNCYRPSRRTNGSGNQ